MKVIEASKINEYFNNYPKKIESTSLRTKVQNTKFFDISMVYSYPNINIHIRSKTKMYPPYFEIRLILLLKTIFDKRYEVYIYINKEIPLYTIKIENILVNPFCDDLTNKIFDELCKDLSVFNKKVEYEKVLPYIKPREGGS